jgi:hypothetical protein
MEDYSKKQNDKNKKAYTEPDGKYNKENSSDSVPDEDGKLEQSIIHMTPTWDY